MPFEIIFLELPTRTHAAYKRVGLLCDSHEGMRMNKACYRDSAPVVQKGENTTAGYISDWFLQYCLIRYIGIYPVDCALSNV